MRRFAVLVAILGVGISLPAPTMADPFDHLSARLAHYEEQLDSGAGGQGSPAESAAPEAAEVLPTPMPDAGADVDLFQGDGTWEEPMIGGDYCSAGGCDPCGCCPRGFWGRAEYLVWWARGASVPPLVTTSPDGTPVGLAGVLPNAQILFGDGKINTHARSGGRFTLGYFADPAQTLGVEDTFFFLGTSNDSFSASSSGSPILARPFFNTESDAQDSLLVAYPQIVLGTINITSSRTILGNEVNLRRALVVDCCRRIDILAGYRFFYMNEGLDVRTNTTSLEGSTSPGTTFAIQDSFHARNQFNGGQLGINWQVTRGCWVIDLVGKLALGGVSQRVKIDGSTVRTIPDEEPQTFEGGVLALPSNIGTYNQTGFGIMPEIGLNARYHWSPCWTVSMGYTFIGLTNVARPGDQIDLRIDPQQLPPGQEGTFPAFAFRDTDLWLQGLNFGIECNF